VAGRIKQEDVDAVRERADIVKIISGHLQLKKAGADRYVGLCPFHPEKTPSFSVSAGKQAYYCFGCGEGGGVFRFVEKLENLSFVEVVEKLAAETGIVLRYEGQSVADRRSSGHRQALHKAIADAARLYQRMLLEGREATEARAYLDLRGISTQSVERFAIGYAPAYPDFLLKRLSKTYSPEVLVEAGLVSKDEGGGLRDRFRGRVMFPIHDLSSNAVGFGGRLLAGPKAPPNAAKYVNSPESATYHKGSLLYNLNRAKPDITVAGRAFLVEGYTDVVALDQAGVREAVATCGTALGEEHVKLLSRFTERLVLAFDSDEAGARAAERAFQFHERYPVDIRVLVLPEGQDPADFALAHGEAAGQAFETLLSAAVPLVEYMVRRSLRGRNLSELEERARAVHEGLGIVMALEDPVRRREYAGRLADLVGVGVNEVLLEMERLTRPSTAPEAAPAHSRRPPHEKVEREALKLLIQQPEACAGLTESISAGQFEKPLHQKIFEIVREADGAPGSALVAKAQERGELVQKTVAGLAVEPLETGDQTEASYAEHVFLRLEEFALSRRIDGVRKELERLNPLKTPDDYSVLFDELVKLQGAKRRAREAAEAIGSSV
jgi:DNA primase